MSDEVDQALDNLSAIKSGGTPETAPQSQDPLQQAEAEVDRLYSEYDELTSSLPRAKLHVGVSRNDGRNGVCKYNKRLTKHRFNKKITGAERASGHVTVVINEKILEQGNRDDFIDTVRHEVAHALCYAMYDQYPSRKKHHDYNPYYKGHGKAWKEVASKLGADPASCHSRRDRSSEFDYYIGCPNCGKSWGRTKRSKVIKQPFNRKCGTCGETGLVSYDAGDEMPEENGTVAVESLPWDNQQEWWEEGSP